MKPVSETGLVFNRVRNLVAQHLVNEYDTVLTNAALEDWREFPGLEKHIERIWIGECGSLASAMFSLPLPSRMLTLVYNHAALETAAVPIPYVDLQIHVYQPPSSSKLTEFSTSSGDDDNDEDGDNDVPAASVLQLPSRSLEGLWDTLVYDGDVKGKLLGYIYSTMLFSDAAVDFNIVTWNR